VTSRPATFHRGYSGAFLAPFRYLGYLTLLLAGLLLAAWVIDAFLVFKIWPDGMQPLEVAMVIAAARSTDHTGYRSSGRRASLRRRVSINV